MFQLDIQELYRGFVCGVCMVATVFNAYLLFATHSISIKVAMLLTMVLCIFLYICEILAYLKIESELRQSEDPLSFSMLSMKERLQMGKIYMAAFFILAIQQIGLLFYLP